MPGASAGVIYSPNFPWNYSNGKTCDWFITAPGQKTINLNFTRFNLESTSYGSCVDYVEVRYGFRSVKYCGSDFPSSITTSGSIRIRFFSDFSVSYSGFMAFYQSEYSFPSTPYPSWPISQPHIWSTYPRSVTMRPTRAVAIRPTWSVAIRPTQAGAIRPTRSVAIRPTRSVAILPTTTYPKHAASKYVCEPYSQKRKFFFFLHQLEINVSWRFYYSFFTEPRLPRCKLFN